MGVVAQGFSTKVYGDTEPTRMNAVSDTGVVLPQPNLFSTPIGLAVSVLEQGLPVGFPSSGKWVLSFTRKSGVFRILSPLSVPSGCACSVCVSADYVVGVRLLDVDGETAVVVREVHTPASTALRDVMFG